MDPHKVYQYSNPGRIVFGPGAVGQLKAEVGEAGKPLIVTDRGVALAGVLEKVEDALGGVPYEIFDGVLPDPPSEVVEEAAAVFRSARCNALIAVGGGSSIDVAKAVSVIGPCGGTVKEYCLGKPIEGALSPVLAVPTTAGTGSEATAVAVVSDHESRMKLVVKHPALIPQVAFLDPLLLSSMPARVAAETGADALTHAVEAYVSSGSHAFTDALALSSIRMILANLPRFVANRADVEAAGQMLLASSMAGQSFKNAGLGLAHAMAHPLGVYFHLSHGLSCAFYLPAVMEFNAPACSDKMALIAAASGADVRGMSAEAAAASAVAAVRDLFRKIGLPGSFQEAGIDFQLHPAMLDEAMAAIPTRTNPRPADKAEVTALFSSPGRR